MSQLLIPDIDDALLEQLRQRAAKSGRSIEAEARQILNDVVRTDTAAAWARINACREQLAATGRDFGDSAQEIREDRDR